MFAKEKLVSEAVVKVREILLLLCSYNRGKIQAYKLFVELPKYFFSIIPLHNEKLIIRMIYSKFE